jgi:hypothetical protein
MLDWMDNDNGNCLPIYIKVIRARNLIRLPLRRLESRFGSVDTTRRANDDGREDGRIRLARVRLNARDRPIDGLFER